MRLASRILAETRPQRLTSTLEFHASMQWSRRILACFLPSQSPSRAASMTRQMRRDCVHYYWLSTQLRVTPSASARIPGALLWVPCHRPIFATARAPLNPISPPSERAGPMRRSGLHPRQQEYCRRADSGSILATQTFRTPVPPNGAA